MLLDIFGLLRLARFVARELSAPGLSGLGLLLAAFSSVHGNTHIARDDMAHSRVHFFTRRDKQLRSNDAARTEL